MSNIQEISLIVLSHGLWGNKNHMGYIEKKLDEKYGDAIHILNASVNEAKYTYDGIDICGRRLADEIESTVVRLGKNGKQITRFSIIGYSLGGLIARYTIGLLGQRGFFNSIEPDYYISFATPHMGVKIPSPSLISKAFNYMSGRLVSRSGEQLQLIDHFDKENDKSMLEVLADPGNK
ncbi:putative serine esterase-domain-containing protein [Pilaira anomala]|nr:putative serine esterase-domain-containing protein [Pilaira anomala]